MAILSPHWCKKFLSYLAGWLTVITWQALVAGTAYVAGTLIQGLLILNYSSYEYQRWHGTLLFYAVLAFSLFINTYLGRHLPQIESMILFFHVLGFFGILIPLVYLAPHQTAHEVFTSFLNKGNWDTTTLAFFVGLITAMDSFPGKRETSRPHTFLLIRGCVGLDAADHIGNAHCGVMLRQTLRYAEQTAEEIQNAPTVIPLSMGVSTLLNGTLGFSMLIALLFCMPSDIQGILGSDTFYPFISVYVYAVGSTAGATAMVSQSLQTT